MNPHFSKEIFEREKAKVLQTFDQLKKDPDSAKNIAWKAWHYEEDFPEYAHLPIGKKSDVENITLDDLRNFYFQNISLEKIFLSIISPNPKEGLLDKLSASFEEMKKDEFIKRRPLKEEEKRNKVNEDNLSEQISKEKEVETLKDDGRPKIFFVYGDESLQQGYFTFAHKLWDLENEVSDRDKVGLYLVNDYLSGGLTGILREQIRGKLGLTYHIKSRMSFSRHTSSDFVITTYTDNKEDNVKKMITEVIKTLEEGQKEGITKREVQKSRNSSLVGFASYLVGDLGSFAESSLFAESEESSFQDKEIFYKFFGYVDSFEAEELNKLFREHIHPKNLKVFVYGPKSLEEDLRSIGSVTMRSIDEYLLKA